MASRRGKRKKNRGRKLDAAGATEAQAPGCAACGASLVAGERFCRSCGAPVAASSKGDKPEPPKPASGSKEPVDTEEVSAAEGQEEAGEQEESGSGESAGGGASPGAADAATTNVAAAAKAPTSGGNAGVPWTRVAAVGGVVLALGVVAAVAIGLGGRGGGSSGGSDDPYKDLTEIENASADDKQDEKEAAAKDNGKLPNQTRKEMTRSVREVIRKHHQYVADGNYQAAFDMMSRRKQGRPLYDNPSCQDASCWGATMGPLTSGLTQPVRPSVRIVRTFKGDGVAEIKVRLPMPSCPNGAWEGITWARYERNNWTYDPGWKTNEPQRNRYDGPGDSQDPRLLGVTCET